MACWRSPKDERAPFDGAKRVGLKVATGVEAAVASTRVDRSDASMRFCDVINTGVYMFAGRRDPPTSRADRVMIIGREVTGTVGCQCRNRHRNDRRRA